MIPGLMLGNGLWPAQIPDGPAHPAQGVLTAIEKFLSFIRESRVLALQLQHLLFSAEISFHQTVKGEIPWLRKKFLCSLEIM